MIDLSPGWAFVVGFAACAIFMAAWMEHARRAPITPEDDYCARVDQELDRAEYHQAAAILAARLDASRGRHPSTRPLPARREGGA